MGDSGPDPAVGWDADPDIRWQEFPSLPGDATADACVVGLGGSGLAAVGDLIERGLDVIGIDAGRIAGGAAGRNGGFLLGGPAQAVHEFATRFGDDVACAFYRQTLAEIDRLATLLGYDVVRRTGSIRIAGLPGLAAPEHPDGDEAAGRAAELADCDAQYAFMTAHGLAVERYDGPLGTGLYFPRDAAMNPVRRAMGLAARYRAGSRLYEHTPATVIGSGRVETPHGSIAADVVIVAVDGGLEALLPQLAGRVRTTRLQMAATGPAAAADTAEVLPCPVYANWGFDYLQQDAARRIFAGGGRDRFLESEWTTQTTPTTEVQRWIDTLIGRVARAASIEPPRITHRWAASVGYTPDGRPLVAQVADGVVACGGYCGTGNLVGPVAARAAVARAVDAAPAPTYFAS